MKDLNHYKEIYGEMKAPDNMEQVIRAGIQAARIKKRRPTRVYALQTVAAVFVLFIITLNVFPTVGNAMSNWPVIGTLVKVFTFTQSKLDGGEVMDGANVSLLSVREKGDTEEVDILFADHGAAPKYTIKYNQNPPTMLLEVHGVRAMDAKAEFEQAAENSNYISDIYQVTTLDDSAMRFIIKFNKNIKYEVKEYRDPSHILITLMESETQYAGNVYSIRTKSMPEGEEIAIVEESFWGYENLRTLKDTSGNSLIEMGTFMTKKEAQMEMDNIKNIYGDSQFLYIEERQANAIPESK